MRYVIVNKEGHAFQLSGGDVLWLATEEEAKAVISIGFPGCTYQAIDA